jgi:hypothetical protein
VIVLQTLGAAQRRLLSGRRPRPIEEATPEPVPTARATVIRATGFQQATEADEWLAGLRSDGERLDTEVGGALADLNAVLRAHRAASADPLAREVSAEQALTVRVGHGEGHLVADGRFRAAYELPRDERGSRRRRREALAPQERLAAVLAGRDHVLVCEELALRARLDLDSGRPREAALQARIALEALLAEVDASELGKSAGALASDRAPVADAANAALEGDLDERRVEAVEEAVRHIEAALRRRQVDRVQRGL